MVSFGLAGNFGLPLDVAKIILPAAASSASHSLKVCL